MIKVYIGDGIWISLVDKTGDICKGGLMKYCDYLGLMEMKHNKLSIKDLSKFVSNQYDRYLSKLKEMIRNNGIYHNYKRI